MFYRNRCNYLSFHYVSSYITLLVFVLTSIAPLYPHEEMRLSKGIISDINPSRKIENLKKVVNKLDSFNEKTSFSDLSTFMNALKRYTEKEIGRKISVNDLYYEVNKKMNELNIYMDSAVVKSCLSKLLNKKSKHKSLVPNRQKIPNKEEEEEISVNAYIVLGCVLITSSTLLAAIGYAVPPLAPFCYGACENIAVLGAGLIATGLCESDKNKKSLFI